MTIYNLQGNICIYSIAFLTALSCANICAQGSDRSEINSVNVLTLEELRNINISIGSHFDESQLTVGSTVDLITHEDWQKTSSHTMWDALNHQPGVHLPATIVASRGMAIRGLTVAPGTRGVAMLVDGVPINNLAHSTGFYPLENIGLGVLNSIEMIRGPGSSIYGADAFQGVLSLSTPTYESDSVEVEGAVGVGEYLQQSLKVGHRLADDTTFNLALDHREDDPEVDYVYGTGDGRLDSNRIAEDSIKNPLESTSIATRLEFNTTEKLALDVGVVANDYERQVFRYVQSNVPRVVELESQFAMFRTGISYDLSSNISFESTVYYWETDWFWDFSTPGNPFRIVIDEKKTGADLHFKQKQNRFNTKWVAGYNYSIAKLNDFRSGSTDGSLKVNETAGQERELSSFYFESRTSFFENHIDLLLGARYDEYSDLGRHTSPRLGVIVYPDDKSAVKLLYGHAFRSPAENEIGANPDPAPNLVFGNEDLDPETIDTYELVYMNSGENQHVEITLFYTKLTDGIIQAPMLSSDPRFVAGNNHQAFLNQAKAKSRGVEAKYGSVWGKLKSNVSLSWIRGENTGDDFDYDGFPKWVGNILLTYNLETYNTMISMTNRFELEKKTYQRTSLSQKSTDLKNYYRADINITKKYDNSFYISLDIMNLFDNDSLYSGAVIANETLIHEPGMAATLTFRYKH